MRLRARGLVVFGFAARDAQCLPVPCAQVLGEEDDLSNVLRVVGERTVERLHHSVRFLAYSHGPLHILGLQRVQRREHMEPRLLPPVQDFCARRFRRDFKFLVAKTVRLLTIAGLGSQ
jgi:hypothetical protein